MLVQLPLRPKNKSSVIDLNALFSNEDFLGRCRAYFGLLRHLNVESNVTEAVSKVQLSCQASALSPQHIQDDFVAIRGQDTRISEDSLHIWLSLHRLYSMSFGEEQPTIDWWSYMKQRESERLGRLRQ